MTVLFNILETRKPFLMQSAVNILFIAVFEKMKKEAETSSIVKLCVMLTNQLTNGELLRQI